MQPGAHPPSMWISYAITAVVVGILLYFRLRKLNQDRPLKVERLWIIPAVYLGLAGFLFWRFPPHGMVWAFCVVALLLGSALGWQRGRMMAITVDPETHEIAQRTSPAAILFLLAIIAVRAGAREMAAYSEATLHLDAMALTDVLIAFALGLLAVQRLEMYLRARRLLDEARTR